MPERAPASDVEGLASSWVENVDRSRLGALLRARVDVKTPLPRYAGDEGRGRGCRKCVG
jgi:hypothetical protein